MKNPILYFFLLILGVLFNPAPDIIYKRNRFSKILLEKDLQLVSDKKNSPLLFFFCLMLLLLKLDFVT